VTNHTNQTRRNSRSVNPPEQLRSFLDEVESRSHANLSACLQCKKCTSGCPVAGRADLKAHELVRMTQLGQRERVLKSKMIWECTSCQTCATRCPQNVSIAAMNDTLRMLSREGETQPENTTTPVFNDIFLRSIKRRGRVYELGLMAAYKFRTLRLMEDVDKAPTMLLKRKLKLIPKNVPGREERKRIFAKARKANRPSKGEP
jgi:heterodisulfide reductase subunit C2